MTYPENRAPRTDEELELAFALHRNPGAYALLIGAGVSRSSGMPSAYEVQASLIHEIASIGGATPHDPFDWYLGQYGTEPRYDDLLRRLGRTRAERQKILSRYFEATDEEREQGLKQPGVAHSAIVRLVRSGRVRIITTLNFDHLIEDALRAAGISVTTVSTPAQFASLNPLHAQDALVVHLHGDYLDPQSMLNTTDELTSYDPRTSRLLAQILSEYGIVIVGWSATWDVALRTQFETNPNRFYSTWWIEPGELSEIAEQLAANRRISAIATSADLGLGRLADAVDALDDVAARHPRSVEIAIASAKRWLAGSARSINLHDEIKIELDRLRHSQVMSTTDFNLDFSNEKYTKRVAQLVEATAVLNGLAATAAMWGSSETDEWWRPEISHLSSYGIRSGSTALINLHRYPASALMYATGIAAVAGGRLDLAFRILSQTSAEDWQGAVRSAGAILQAAEVLEDARPSRTMNLHLQDLFTRGLTLGEDGYSQAWEVFEYLLLLQTTYEDVRAAAPFLELIPLAKAAWAAQPDGPGYQGHALPEEAALRKAVSEVHAPVRSVPHLRTAGYGAHYAPLVSASLRREVSNAGESHPWVRAGFAGGEVSTFRAAVSILDSALASYAHDAAYSILDDGQVHTIPTSRFWIDEMGKHSKG